MTTKTGFFVLLCTLLFTACTKIAKEGYIRGGVALTFDDNYIDEWHRQIPLFDSFDVKATFFVSNYNKLSKEQKGKLHDLQAHGHEIAYHSLNHVNFLKYEKNNKVSELMKNEVDKGMEMMKADGFCPKTFAYPFGSHSDALDNVLLRKFKSVRALNGTRDLAKSFTATTDNTKLYAIGMDNSSGKTTEQLVGFIQTASNNNTCLVLVGHHVEKPGIKMQVPYERLKKILTTARELNMQFYTAAELSPR
jgi:peptidoglycan-N-acetylglucosamine deacetylase